MLDKSENFDELPDDLKLEIAEKLPTADLVHWAKTSKAHYALFKPLVDVRKLVHHVVRGKHDEVKSILKDNINLIFQRGKITDCSGREFESISAFEYALWAMDKHMWTGMIACIPQNDEGKWIFQKLVAQYDKVTTEGVTYRLNGEKITEKHFDFKNTIIKELQTQIDSINAPGDKNWAAIDKHWREGVGGAQKRLPMHIVDEYCSNEPFFPVPKFASQPKSSQKFYYACSGSYEDWFAPDSLLGSMCAIYKGWRRRRARGEGGGAGTLLELVRIDLGAMEALCEVRTLDLINLKSELEKQAGLECHHHVVPMILS